MPKTETENGNGSEHEEPQREEREVNGATLLETIQELINEGTVQRITILDNDNRTILSFPVIVGVPITIATAMMAPPLAAAGAIGALVSGCRVVIERDLTKE